MKKKEYSPEEQLAIVKMNVKRFRYISNPTDETIEYVLNQSPFMIEELLKDDAEVYKKYVPLALHSDIGVISVIDESLIPYATKYELMSIYGWYLKFINDQTEELVEAAIMSNPYAIKFNKCHKDIDKLIEINPNIIQHIYSTATYAQCVRALELRPRLYYVFLNTKRDDVLEYINRNKLVERYEYPTD